MVSVEVVAALAVDVEVVRAPVGEARRRERAVRALLRGGEAPLGIAGRFGVSSPSGWTGASATAARARRVMGSGDGATEAP